MAPEILDSRPGPESPRRRLTRPILFISAAALVIAGGVGVAAAATSGAKTGLSQPVADAPTATPPSDLPLSKSEKFHQRMKGLRGKDGVRGPGKMMLGHGMFGAGGAVRGEVVVPKEGGGYQTIAFQTGKVTAVGASSLTVKSADGVSRTYTVGKSTIVRAERDGIGSIKKNDDVFVNATASGDTLSATRVVDMSQVNAANKRWGWGPRHK